MMLFSVSDWEPESTVCTEIRDNSSLSELSRQPDFRRTTKLQRMQRAPGLLTFANRISQVARSMRMHQIRNRDRNRSRDSDPDPDPDPDPDSDSDSDFDSDNAGASGFAPTLERESQ